HALELRHQLGAPERGERLRERSDRRVVVALVVLGPPQAEEGGWESGLELERLARALDGARVLADDQVVEGAAVEHHGRQRVELGGAADLAPGLAMPAGG